MLKSFDQLRKLKFGWPFHSFHLDFSQNSPQLSPAVALYAVYELRLIKLQRSNTENAQMWCFAVHIWPKILDLEMQSTTLWVGVVCDGSAILQKTRINLVWSTSGGLLLDNSSITRQIEFLIWGVQTDEITLLSGVQPYSTDTQWCVFGSMMI